MELKDFIAEALETLIKCGAKGEVVFDLYVEPVTYRCPTYKAIVISQSPNATNIKIKINI